MSSSLGREKAMQAQAPKLIAITHDQYHANLVGRTQNGLQVSSLHHLCPLWEVKPGVNSERSISSTRRARL